MRTYPVEIAGVRRDLPIVQVGPDVAVALLNLLGDTELTEAAAEALAQRLPPEVETLVTPEVKAVPLAHALSRVTGRPYVVARKTEKPYMINPVSRQVLSITTGKPQLLVLDGADIPLIRGRKVAIVDDVVSTGSTLSGLRELIESVGGQVVAVLAVFTEGTPRQDVIALGHLPLFKPE
ncbi:MAG: phosphoribosyltransferase family protein [Thermus sp.]|uniref:phosphoribosyltransferase family protein n=1 Tax=unclassified Thermus TaxID=2619321 RepID=UPI0012DE8574|nr:MULTISPECIES: phosphoribosyltransferase family protein [unclassified Thermus]MCS6868844.1 phosphoribosyltransferase family protein [Thermus sp.]MCS7218398.1 phosphoribosyltransferase family protein [Thermus sp.]MCX7849280.1 phosphoribosyltransferase family protein [Thermus sp.]MDW8016847.1 phosphoribosyltransferase family protein [Thermus sp.]MDW8356998.1 phosphoribosyltransferase family protein [Thermus sp.]